MKWLCRYVDRKTGEEYWRTVFADSEPEAYKLACHYIRGGFILLSTRST